MLEIPYVTLFDSLFLTSSFCIQRQTSLGFVAQLHTCGAIHGLCPLHFLQQLHASSYASLTHFPSQCILPPPSSLLPPPSSLLPPPSSLLPPPSLLLSSPANCCCCSCRRCPPPALSHCNNNPPPPAALIAVAFTSHPPSLNAIQAMIQQGLSQSSWG